MERARIDGLEGLVQVSVWQDLQQRTALATDLAIQSGLTALFLIGTVFLVVFFGIRLGLQPLSSVEQQSVSAPAQIYDLSGAMFR